MGRSPFFNCRKIEFPERLSIADKLSKLAKGDYVWITVGSCSEQRPVGRTPSTYGLKTSSYDAKLVVDSVDYCSGFFDEFKEKCIVFREPQIPIDDHIYDWCVTTDGYEREPEHFGITGEVIDIQVVSQDAEKDISQVLSLLTVKRAIRFKIEKIPSVFQLPHIPSLLPEQHTSDIDAHYFVIDFIEDGLIHLRDAMLKKENHVCSWFLRTDGIIIQCDVFEPLYKITNLCVY